MQAGDVACREGGPGDEFFVLEEGTAVATVCGEQVAAFGPGELALLAAGGSGPHVV